MILIFNHIFLILLLGRMTLINGVSSVNKDLILSTSEKLILEQFKKMMIPKLEVDYMKSDIFLVKWLRATNFEVARAEVNLLQNIAWRKKNKMDTILEEDWSNFDRLMGYDISSVDKNGRPILYYRFGEWDIRQAIVTGQRQKMMRYLALSYELADINVRKKQAQGQEVTRAIFIANIEGFSLIQSACLQCLTIYAEVFRLQSYYPGLLEKLYVVNAPVEFQGILTLASSILPGGVLEVLGSSNKEFRKALLKTISSDQLPVELGGTKILLFEMEAKNS